MAYIEGRVVHDADAHVMETAEWFDMLLDGTVDERVQATFKQGFGEEERGFYEQIERLQRDPAHRAKDAEELMSRKNHHAIGAFLKEDRTHALDLLGVASQLLFTSRGNVLLESLEHGDDLDLLYGTASASNRAQVEYSRVDRRLLPVGYVPLADLDRASKAATEAIELGCSALLVPAECPRRHATSHLGLDSVWAQAQDARLPILFHVGVADRVLPKAHKNNGLPAVPDFHGGDENFRSISYMSIPSMPMQALSLLIFDGVLDRFPQLMVGVIELGAVWMPGYMRQLDAAFEAFSRHEERLQGLALKPSEYIHRQVRVTPYPTEPAGWIIEQAGEDICMFSSDYPHVEGGRNPYGRFERSTEGLTEVAIEKFYAGNFASLMGPHLAVT